MKLPRRKKFKPRNIKKYKGNVNNIISKSSWEEKLMNYFDLNDFILEWSSEEIYIRYKNPIDKKYHKYYPDFWVKLKKGKEIKEFLIEVKPLRKLTYNESFSKTQKAEFIVNQAKFKAALKFCKKNNYEFRILTELDIKKLK